MVDVTFVHDVVQADPKLPHPGVVAALQRQALLSLNVW